MIGNEVADLTQQREPTLRWLLFSAFCFHNRALWHGARQKPMLFSPETPSAYGMAVKAFTFLIRPTAQEFYNFVHLLDKALSDNINKKFFESDMPVEEDIHRADGKVEVRQIGTIRLLEQWLAEHWILQDPKQLQEALA